MSDIHPTDILVSQELREAFLGQRGSVVWLTGLSGAGKSTIARALEEYLTRNGRFAYVLDGDNVRTTLCSDLGFNHDDRLENMRRVGSVANLFADAGVIVIGAFISPLVEHREKVRQYAGPHEFVEVFVDAPVELCIERDPKGLYAKALNGEIANFTGVSSSYIAPESPDIHIHTDEESLDQCVQRIADHLLRNRIISFSDEADGSGI